MAVVDLKDRYLLSILPISSMIIYWKDIYFIYKMFLLSLCYITTLCSDKKTITFLMFFFHQHFQHFVLNITLLLTHWRTDDLGFWEVQICITLTNHFSFNNFRWCIKRNTGGRWKYYCPRSKKCLKYGFQLLLGYYT